MFGAPFKFIFKLFQLITFRLKPERSARIKSFQQTVWLQKISRISHVTLFQRRPNGARPTSSSNLSFSLHLHRSSYFCTQNLDKFSHMYMRHVAFLIFWMSLSKWYLFFVRTFAAFARCLSGRFLLSVVRGFWSFKVCSILFKWVLSNESFQSALIWCSNLKPVRPAWWASLIVASRRIQEQSATRHGKQF